MTRQFINYSVAITTPFTKEGDFDASSIPALIKYYVQDLKFPGLLISGSTGEQHCLTLSERVQLYQLVQANVPKDYPVYAGVAAFKTKDAIVLAQAAEEAGLSGIMLGLPPYRIPSQTELETYIHDVASATQLPIFIYNNPRRNGCAVEPSTFIRVAAAHTNIVGVKEAGHPPHVADMKTSDHQVFFTGSDVNFIEEYTVFGYTGITSIFANVFPAEMEALVDHVFKGEIDQAKAILETLKPKIETVSRYGVLQSIKYILRERGLPAGYCPAPLEDVSKEAKEALKAFV